MKLLLIALLAVACGKREEPKALDYADSDGDQRLNYEEPGLEKHVANFAVLGPISGVLRVRGERLLETTVTNQHKLGERIADLLVRSEDRITGDGFFDENSRLHLAERLPLPAGATAPYQVTLKFSFESAAADEIVFVSREVQVVLAKWGREVSFSLAADRLKAVVRGDAYLAVRRQLKRGRFFTEETERSIREKSYRVYVHDGTAGRAFYVSRELSFEDFLRHRKITPYTVASEDDFFYSGRLAPEEGWFLRQLRNGDRVLMFARFEELRSRFLSGFTYRKTTIARTNGSPDAGVRLENKAGAKVYLRLRSPLQVSRRFSETSEKRTYREDDGNREGSGGAYTDCTHYLRRIAEEVPGTPDLLEIQRNLESAEALFRNAAVTEEADAEGPFWELKLGDLDPNQEITFRSKPGDSYTITGEYRNNCKRKPPSRGRDARVRTNSEGKLSFVLESYVEKID
jgi:hypothetical protein